ncbi:PfaD family polyunsaturated fatty acid/polyketide biosynthesis protein [Streptomyces wedmorensis]|uniref:PfaD family polyunsaturated fatty acid/polyketide biosynthesis protein n=1 Tax=Streptomyces wedmorensis TaxID=43759 RepID=UPI0037A957B8
MPPAFTAESLAELVRCVRDPVHVIRNESTGGVGLALGGEFGPSGSGPEFTLLGTVPGLYPEWLGDRGFCEVHAVRFPYVAGEMANGIATVDMVSAMARAEMISFFGAGGLSFDVVERATVQLKENIGDVTNWGVNLIHSPQEPELENRVAGLLLSQRVPIVSASAFMDLTPAVVRCAVAGLTVTADGQVRRRTQVFAKVSRPEVAERFMAPAPPRILDHLVAHGEITRYEAELAARVPVAEDITVESDSGGHTDNRPLGALLPAILSLRDKIARENPGIPRVRVGAAGGLGTPDAVASAFALGAAYVVTGSVNQVAREAGLSDEAKGMLAAADLADVTMAPAADMFELGVKLQVLRRGTMFAARATQLYDAYVGHSGLDDIPAELRQRIERDVLGASFEEIWQLTERFWQQRDPAEITRAAGDTKHRMALVFRWYLGNSSRWAIDGHPKRRTDYQIWCGPAMGAFNRWVAGSFLADPAERTVVQIAYNLVEGAAALTRAHQLRTYGVPVPDRSFVFPPRRLA